MRFYAQRALLFLLLGLAATPAALAQEKRGSANALHQVSRKDADLQPKAIHAQPLTLGESLAILGAALDSHHRHANLSSDCSHFVHELYERAGFPYEYASSSDLYAGIDEFRRVTNPQPGDLAVWRGHAGIVVNPAQHTFFSALRSGPGVDSYDAPYWKRRGRPRFFRYIKPAPILSKSIRKASLQPAVLGNSQPRKPVAEEPISDESDESSSANVPSPKLVQNQLANAEITRIVLVDSVRPKPDQVSAAFLQACKESEERLRWHDFFNPARSLIVFDHFEVKKVHIKRNRGWADVRIDQRVTFTGSKAEVHKRSERQRWPLSRRDNAGWELTPAPNTIYLPQHIAERILAHELAQLTEDSSATASRTGDKAELARLLGALLEK
jgi:hypothetical protein